MVTVNCTKDSTLKLNTLYMHTDLFSELILKAEVTLKKKVDVAFTSKYLTFENSKTYNWLTSVNRLNKWKIILNIIDEFRNKSSM